MSSSLPAGWASTTLGDVARLVSGAGFPLDEQNQLGLALPFFKVGNLAEVDANETLLVSSHTIDHVTADRLRAEIIPPKSIVFAKIGMAIRLNRRRLVGIHCCIDNNLFAAVPGIGVTPAFLLLVLQTHDLMPMAQATTVPSLRKGDVESIEISLPPLNEQKRIVAKIEELTARSRRAKQALEAVPPLLDKLRQSILAAAFRGDLTADWRAKNPNVEPADQLLARIRAERRSRWEAAELAKMQAKGKAPDLGTLRAKYKEPEVGSSTQLADLPNTWAWVSIELAGDVLLGRRRAGEEYVDGQEGRQLRPYVRVANVKYDRLALDDVFSMPFNAQELELYRLRPGDIVLSEGQSPELVGQSGVFEGNFEDLCIQATVHRFRAYPFATSSSFAQLVFLSHLHTGVFRRASQQTTNMAHLTSERLRPLPFPVPPLAEQAIIVDRVRQALDQVTRLIERSRADQRAVTKLDASILAKAFRGELVPQDPTDEPASVLLERIRAARTTSPPATKRTRPRAEPPAPTRQSATPPAPTKPARQPQLSLDLEPAAIVAEIHAALWPHGPLDKDTAVCKLADHLRERGLVEFQRLRADGPLYARLLAAIEAAAKAGQLDRPKRGQVRAFKSAATDYTPDDWRHVLVSSLGPAGSGPVHQEDAIRQAAEWARDNLGLEFVRLPSNGHISEGIRSAINSGIRRGLIERDGPRRVKRSTG